MNNDTNGADKSPQQKAWDTAREQGREHGRSVRDEEIRCIKSKALSSWAKLFFWVLSKICWEKSPFIYNHSVGRVCILGSELKKYYAYPTKRLYAQNKPIKNKAGKVLRIRSTPGAIEELVAQGFIWISRKPVRNIPAMKWPNVFNLSALVPQIEQSKLGLLEDVVVVDDEPKQEIEPQYTTGGARVFLPKNDRGACQTPPNGLAKPGETGLPSTNGGSGQTPPAGLAKHQRGDLASTPSGVLLKTTGGSSQAPPVVQGQPRPQGLANPASRIPNKTSDSILTSRHRDGEDPTPENEFEDWLKTLPGMLPSRLHRLDRILTEELHKAKSLEARKDLQRRIAAVRIQMIGRPIEDKLKPAEKPVESKPTMSPEEQKKAWEKTKADIAAAAKTRWSKPLKPKTAATAAART